MNGAKKLLKRVFDTLIKKPVQTYNLEERAFKAISVPKRDAAPKHLSTQEKILKYIEEHPELRSIAVEKPTALIEWLKKIRVVSYDLPDTELIKPDKSKLPSKRTTYELPSMFGELEPKVVPKGKISLKRTTNLIVEYASSEIKPSASEIADKYDLDEQDAANLVRHFKAFEMYQPAAESGDYTGLPPWSMNTQKDEGFLAMVMPEETRFAEDMDEEEKKLFAAKKAERERDLKRLESGESDSIKQIDKPSSIKQIGKS